jgi:acetoin utilization protein AcuB
VAEPALWEEPTIRQYMTRIPYTVEAAATLHVALGRMQEYGIRHLPVTDKGRIVGMLSDRDVKLVAGIEGVKLDKTLVIDACHGAPFVVSPDASLRRVAAAMAKKRYGSAIVAERGRPVGIFTTVDACRALAALVAAQRAPRAAPTR